MWQRIFQITSQLIRRIRETIGLPVSTNVGRLSTIIKELRTIVELQLGHEVSAIMITIPSIAALYDEDLWDAFAYSGLQYVEIYPYNNHRRIHDTSAVYAGHSPTLVCRSMIASFFSWYNILETAWSQVRQKSKESM